MSRIQPWSLITKNSSFSETLNSQSHEWRCSKIILFWQKYVPDCFWCNSKLFNPQGLKTFPEIAWPVIFPSWQVWPQLDSLRESYAKCRNVTCLWDNTGERNCTACHVSLVQLRPLKKLPEILQSVHYLSIFTKFYLELPSPSYGLFS